MISVSEGIEKDRLLIQSHIKQDIKLSSEGIDGMIAYFGANYEGNRLQLYIKDKEAYLHIDNKNPGYLHTLCIWNRSAGDMTRIDIMKEDSVLIDLDEIM